MTFKRASYVLALLVCIYASLVASGIAPALIPNSVATANKRGNSNVFQLALNNSAASAGTAFCDDGSGNATTSGCAAAGGVGNTLFSSTTTAGPSNTATQTTLIGTVTGNKSIAANTFANGVVLESRVQGFFSLPTVADALTLRVKCGSTVLASASTTLPAGVLANGTFRLWLMITAQGSGAGGSLMTNGLAEFSGSGIAPSEVKVLNTSAIAFDFTTACAFDMTAQWGGAQVGESISGTNAAAWTPGAGAAGAAGATGATGASGTGTKGTATFTAVSGTLVVVSTTGNVSGVTRSGTGQFAIALTGSPSNYIVSMSCGDTATLCTLQIDPTSSYTTTGFSIVCLTGGGGNTLLDPDLVTLAIL